MSERVKGATSVSMLFRLTDSTTGLAKSGIDVTTLKLQYERPGEAVGTATSLTLLAALTTAWTSYGAKECDATNSKGIYRVDPPNLAFATGADEVTLSVSGTGIETATRLVDLMGADMRDSVRIGLTALPNATAGANTGLPVVGTQVPNATAGASAGLLISGSNSGTTTLGALTVTGATTATGGIVGNVTGNLSGSVGSVAGAVGGVTAAVTVGTNNDKTGYALTSAYDAAKTAAQAGDTMKVSSGTGANQISLSSGTVTVGTNNDKTGYTASTVSDKTGYSLTVTPPTAAAIAAATRDVSNTSPAASSLGAAVNSAASAGDPWSTALPGPYGPGTAGYIVGTNLAGALSGTLGDQSAGSVDAVVLPSGPAANGVLAGSRLRITSGAAQYQERTITGWVGATKIAGIDEPFAGGTPASGDTFEVRYDHSHQLESGNVLATGQVSSFQAGAVAQLFTLDSGMTYADAVDGSPVKEIATNIGAVASVTAPVAITSNLKKNQARAAFPFVMTDSTNHAPVAGLTVTATRSLDGAAFAACANAPAGIASGTYKIDLATTDLNASTITLRFTATGADDLLVTLVTQP